MYAASDSTNDLPVFPMLKCASKHDLLSSLHTLTMKSFIPKIYIEKLRLNSVHDAYSVYDYCQRQILSLSLTWTLEISEISNKRIILRLAGTAFPSVKWACLYTKTDAKLPGTARNAIIHKLVCFCEHPCSTAKFGRTVHIYLKDNPRLFNIPSRSSMRWSKEYDTRIYAERSNKLKKEDHK